MSGPQAIAKSPRTGDGPLWMGGCIGGSLNGGASAANAADTKKRGEKHQRQMRRPISICSLRLSGLIRWRRHILSAMRRLIFAQLDRPCSALKESTCCHNEVRVPSRLTTDAVVGYCKRRTGHEKF